MKRPSALAIFTLSALAAASSTLPASARSASLPIIRSDSHQGLAAPAKARTSEVRAPSTSPEGSDPAVDSLSRELSLTPGEAQTQMAAQVAAGRAEKNMPDDLREVYGGRTIQHDRKALVTVGVSDASRVEAMRQYFAEAGVSNLQVEATSNTQASLENLIDELNGQLRQSPSHETNPRIAMSLTGVNQITVELGEGELDEHESVVMNRVSQSPEIFVVVRVDRINQADEQACNFSGTINCDAPLRGSVRFGNTSAGCTAGFLVVSNVDLKPYVMTAGHCNNTSTMNARFEDNSLHPVGKFHNAVNNLDTDVGIVTVSNPEGWQFYSTALVTVDPSGGETANESYGIADSLNPAVGDRVCYTGSYSSRTDCGEVATLYGNAGGTDGLFKVDDLCTTGGDSGGPYFAAHVAYGIHSAGYSSGCLGGWAEQAPEAESQMNVTILGS